MDKKQFSIFAMALKTYYPKENLLPNEQAMELWFAQLSDIPYDIAQAGLQRWVSLNKWSPSIAEIREMASKVTHGEIPDWSEAWDEVNHAIRNYGAYRAQEALDSLSPIARLTAKRIGFTKLCHSENQSADRANFRMIYENLAENEQKNQQMPDSLKMLIADIQRNMIEVKGGE